jgi:hypothetical protein
MLACGSRRGWKRMKRMSGVIVTCLLSGAVGACGSGAPVASHSTTPTASTQSVASATTAATTTATTTSQSVSAAINFQSPTGNIDCQLGGTYAYAATAYCQASVPAATATLKPSGALQNCYGTHCLGNPPSVGVKTAQYGTSESVAPFRCVSAVTGMTCLTTDGVGFKMSRSGIARIGPSSDITTSLATVDDITSCLNLTGTGDQILAAIPGCLPLLNTEVCRTLVQVSSGSISCAQAVKVAATDFAESAVAVEPQQILGFQCYASTGGVYCSRGSTSFTVQIA